MTLVNASPHLPENQLSTHLEWKFLLRIGKCSDPPSLKDRFSVRIFGQDPSARVVPWPATSRDHQIIQKPTRVHDRYQQLTRPPPRTSRIGHSIVSIPETTAGCAGAGKVTSPLKQVPRLLGHSPDRRPDRTLQKFGASSIDNRLHHVWGIGTLASNVEDCLVIARNHSRQRFAVRKLVGDIRIL